MADNKQTACSGIKDKRWAKVWIVIWKQYKEHQRQQTINKTCKAFLAPSKWIIKLDTKQTNQLLSNNKITTSIPIKAQTITLDNKLSQTIK